MASLGIKSGLNYSNLFMDKSHQISFSIASFFLSNPTKKRATQAIYASNTVLEKPSLHEESSIDQQKDSFFPSKIDDWMEETAEDIVKNLKQAPLLVHIYDKNGKAKFKTEKAVMENWPIVRSEWENGESKSPDGLIFVEEIETIDDDNKKDFDGFEEGVTRAWGIVVQGKGIECGPACYLLKTSRVGAGLGLGMCCTHFCLMRVKSFSKSALRQFEESWLLR